MFAGMSAGRASRRNPWSSHVASSILEATSSVYRAGQGAESALPSVRTRRRSLDARIRATGGADVSNSIPSTVEGHEE